VQISYPSLYQVNTRVSLTALAREMGRPATLDDIPDSELDGFAALGFDWIWLLSVWQTGAAGQRVSRENPEWRREFEATLPDLAEADIAGSGFAITGYTVHPELGGDAALARLRGRLGERGLRLLLDFVPNHTGLDHPWVEKYPERYVVGTERDLGRTPGNYAWVTREAGNLLLAHGRDPNFPGWPDTFQLNYANEATQEAMTRELLKIAGQCDGVRCDMAMLLLPEIFERTWGIRPRPFWPEAIRRVREKVPSFVFMAEAYWDLEWELQQQGFDYAYDKRLYDRLRDGHVPPVREHLAAHSSYQTKLIRFLENHDEPRAAAVFPAAVHRAAAAITFLSPGLRFFNQGQLEGHTKRISPHLCRAPDEPVDEDLAQFYDLLLALLKRPALRAGDWHSLPCRAAWDGNWTSDCILAFAWRGDDGERLLIPINYADHHSQCYVELPSAELGGRAWRLQDLTGDAVYDRNGDELSSRGLYLDLQPWQFHVFTLEARSPSIDSNDPVNEGSGVAVRVAA
jgi:Alpha amylase, catalytic domain